MKKHLLPALTCAAGVLASAATASAQSNYNYEPYFFGTLAGLAGGREGSADGTGSAARFVDPSGVATDSAGNVVCGRFLQPNGPQGDRQWGGDDAGRSGRQPRERRRHVIV